MKRATHYWLINQTICIAVLAGQSYASTGNQLTREQAGKLVSALSAKPIQSIDARLHKRVTKPKKDIDEIRKEVEKEHEKLMARVDKLSGPGIIIEKPDLEEMFNRKIKEYNQPRVMEEHIRIDGGLYRLDQIMIESDKKVATTFVNCGDKEKGDYTHFAYHHEVKTANISNNKSRWGEHRLDEWAGMPKAIRFLFRMLLNKDESESEVDNTISNEEAINKLVNGQIEGFRIQIDPEKNNNQCVIISISMSFLNNTLYTITVDKHDYTRVYHFERYSMGGELQYRRDTNTFGENGYPLRIEICNYDSRGQLRDQTTAVVEKVVLEPELPAALFAFTVPPGYTMIDDRQSPALIVRPKEN